MSEKVRFQLWDREQSLGWFTGTVQERRGDTVQVRLDEGSVIRRDISGTLVPVRAANVQKVDR